ncbi:hypothetical protein B0J13DRAFT_528102 [Dactylonectria estremocensis]|uniref:Uncharacterized protein n=1 Tax=Dactylonectria estremocensis TaxID=1079267 RepID=A0A9P9J0Y1_9HYPO|nr:hypothetical protein B0J13DRAFT_528102 [Dactylonectria estremocensis]
MRFRTVFDTAMGLLASSVLAATDAEASGDFFSRLNQQALDLLNSTETKRSKGYNLFNGSIPPGNLFVPSGKGGGCVKSGPFKDMELHPGPVSNAMRSLAANPSPDGRLGYNPRCLSRDLSPYIFTLFFTLQNLVNITTGSASNTIGSF